MKMMLRSRSLGMGLSALALGALALVPTEREAHAAPPAWETSWDNAWARAAKYYDITAAPTVAGDPTCQGDLGFNPRIKELTRAIATRRYGEATRLLGVVQDKSLCLTLEGSRGLEYALAGWIHFAMRDLQGADQDIAVHGALNAAALSFDSLQYTRRSWLLPVVILHADKLDPIVARYPKNDLGFYAFDWSRGALASGVDPGGFVRALRDIRNFGDGSCALLDMAAANFVCKGWVGKNGMGAGGGAGGAAGAGGAVGGLPSTGRGAAAMSCMVDAAKNSGGRAQLGCAAKAVAGMTFDPKTASATNLMSQGILGGQAGVRDPSCARSEDAGNGGKQQDPKAKDKEPTVTWDKVVAAATAVKDYAVAVVDAVFNKTPVGISEASQLASTEGADAVRGGLQAAQAIKARDALLSDNEDAIDNYNRQRAGRVVTNPQANQRTAGDLPSGPLGGNGGGSCSRGSNAARRANALYDCITGGGPKPTNRGPNNPLVSMTDPAQVQSKPTGALACMQQGGDLPRTALMDAKCANTRCAEGALSCPCDRSGGGNAAVGQGFTPRLTASTSPNCAEPGCNPTLPKPPGGGTITGPGGPQPSGPGGTITGPGPRTPKP